MNSAPPAAAPERGSRLWFDPKGEGHSGTDQCTDDRPDGPTHGGSPSGGSSDLTVCDPPGRLISRIGEAHQLDPFGVGEPPPFEADHRIAGLVRVLKLRFHSDRHLSAIPDRRAIDPSSVLTVVCRSHRQTGSALSRGRPAPQGTLLRRSPRSPDPDS